MLTKKTILFVVNVDWFFISHRLVLADAAIKNGYKVIVAATDSGRRNEIEKIGASFIDVNFDRSGTNPFKELKSLISLFLLYRSIKPDLVQHITLKPVSYGSFIARLLNIPSVNAISGLGYAFQEGKSGLASTVMAKAMRFGFNKEKVVCIFQNKDDLATVQSRSILSPKNKIVMIKGAGVDLNYFKYSEAKTEDKLKIILPARLLWDKGIREFKEASELLRSKYEGAIVFQLVGMVDVDNKAGVGEEELKSWIVDSYFEWLPYQKEMYSVYEASNIVVLPSYREGMPKSLLEACAVGRPIVTTDAIGCKECVDEGVNGFKVKVKSAEELASAIEKLIASPELRIRMGKAAREKAEKEFDVNKVVEKHLEIYRELSND